MSKPTSSIPSSLVRKLLLYKQPDQRITKDGVEVAGELIHQFIVEAWNRASFEAEFEHDTNVSDSSSDDDDDNGYLMNTGKRKRGDGDEDNKKRQRIEIKAEHVMKIGAELLLDFS